MFTKIFEDKFQYYFFQKGYRDQCQYAVTSSGASVGGVVTVQVQCSVVGVDGNMDAGEVLTLVTPVPGLQSNGTSGDISGGADIESIPNF